MDPRTTKALLYLNGVSVSFDGFRALNNLSFTVEPGELLGIGRKFQKPTVFDMHTVEDNIALALKSDRRARKTLLWRETAEEASRINSILEITRLSSLRARVAGSLSHGQKQWLEIGMLLAQEP